MRKRMTGAALLLGMAVLLAACSQKGDEETQAQTETQTEAQSAQAETEAGETTAAIDTNYRALDYVTLGQYKGFELDKALIEATDEEVNQVVDNALAQVWSDVTDRTTVQEGDNVVMDYEGKLDGEAFDGGSAQDATLEIGSGRFIDGFEDGLVGAEVGKEVVLDLTFPDPYENNPDLAGKPVQFYVTVKSIQEHPTEMTDELAKDEFGHENAEALYAFVSDRVRTSNILNEIAQQVLDNATIEGYPEEIRQYYIDSQLNSLEMAATMYGMTLDDYFSYSGTTQEEYEELLKEAFDQDMILKAIAETENLELSDEEFNQRIEEEAVAAGVTSEQYVEYYGEDNLKRSLRQEIVQDFIVNSIVEK